MTTTDHVAATRGVTKSFGGQVAVDGVDLHVTRGESLGLLGPNGAGKTTLLSMLIGLRRPDGGTVELFGGDPLDPATRRRLGVTPQATAVPQNLRVREVVDFVGAHFGDPRGTAELIGSFGLAEVADKQCGGLSGGQQRRLLVALALVGNPDLVVLDEPTTGLDVTARDRLWERLRDYREAGGTLVVTSHYLAEIEALASRVVVMDHGSVIADGTVRDITRRVQVRRIVLRTTAPDHELLALPGAVTVTSQGDTRVVATRDADAAVRTLCAAGVPFSDLEVHAASLEEAFVALTAGSDAESIRPAAVSAS